MANAQCSMLKAQCPMLNAQCPMPNAQCVMLNAQVGFGSRSGLRFAASILVACSTAPIPSVAQGVTDDLAENPDQFV
jgi:hypothetical protein